MTKVCRDCGEDKPLQSYYKHSGMKDGHLNKCKACKREYSKSMWHEKKKDKEWREEERRRSREKYHRLNYREKQTPNKEDKRRFQEKYREEYPEKYRAQNLSQHIPVPDGFHRHHWSYTEGDAKDIIPLPADIHYRLHRYMEYNQEEMKYETIDGDLLATKDDHIEYMESVVGMSIAV